MPALFRLLAALVFLMATSALLAQNAATISPDGSLIAKADGKSVSMFDARTQKEICRFLGHTDDVTAMAFSADGKKLATGSKDQSVGLWDVPTGKQLLKVKGGAAVKTVHFSADSKQLFSREADDTLREFDAATGQELRTTPGKK